MFDTSLFLLCSLLLLAVAGCAITAYVRRSAAGVAPIDSNLADIFLLSFIVVLSLLLGAQASRVGTDLWNDCAAMSVFVPTLFLQMVIILGVFVYQKMSSSKFMLFSIPTVRTALTGTKFAIAALILVILSSFSVSAAVELLTGGEPEQQDVLTIFLAIESVPVRIAALVSMIVFAPIAEELFFRGVIYRILKGEFTFFSKNRKEVVADGGRIEFTPPSVYRIGMAAVGSALLFAFIHVNIYAFFPLFVMGLILVACYERSGNIFAPILTHAIFNAANLGAALLLPLLQ